MKTDSLNQYFNTFKSLIKTIGLGQRIIVSWLTEEVIIPSQKENTFYRRYSKVFAALGRKNWLGKQIR